MTRLLPLLGLAAGLLLAGCLSGGGEPDMVANATVDDPTLEPGSWVNVSYRLENRGDAPYEYKHPGCPPAPVDADVRVDGEEVEVYRYRNESKAGICKITNKTVAPGEAVTGVVNWNGRTRADPPNPHAGDRVAAGSHDLTVRLARADGGPGFPVNVTVQVQG